MKHTQIIQFALLLIPFFSFSQNVGIGTTTPTRAKLEVHGAVSRTTAIFGGDTTGISLQSKRPGVGFNHYESDDARYIANGFGAVQYLDPITGEMKFYMLPYGLKDEIPDDLNLAMVIRNNGNIGVGIVPDAKAVLDIQSTDKGVLFPRLTNSQRNAISNPPNGLHIFNTEERCLNYYDADNQIWNCYCASCETVVITITTNLCKVDFYEMFARVSPAKKYLIKIAAGVVISGCNPGDTALSFNSLPFNASVIINNFGTIAGAGGKGGNATINNGCMTLSRSAEGGQNGGYAISTKSGIPITIKNYGIIAGAGGGGGGSGGIASSNGFGGGGGGGAGIVVAPGGNGGGVFIVGGPPIYICAGGISYFGQAGTVGQSTLGGSGGAGASGGFAGGNGGGRGQAGQAGAGYLGGLQGGTAGKAIGGGTGNSITNISGGQFFGLVD